MTLIFIVILVALVFEYINGFHDTANSIATVVSTKVLTPRQAVVLAAITNLLGALWGTAFAKTISSGLVDSRLVSMTSDIIICALLAAIAWNLLTWWFGLPSSSSHALIGGLCGSALAASGNHWHVIIWAQPDPKHWWLGKGLLWKVIVPMITSPLAGFLLGFVFMAFLYVLLQNARPTKVNRFFGVAQMFGQVPKVPWWLSFLRMPVPAPGKDPGIALWIKIICALTMAAGTAVGGWRIIKTLGHKMVKLHPINGFAAEASSATVIATASSLGVPVSTTHNISAAIMGVGAARRLNAIKWVVVERMVWAWILTIPVTAGLAYSLVRCFQTVGFISPL